MSRAFLIVLSLLMLLQSACVPKAPPVNTGSLKQARQGFKTKLERRIADQELPPQPPEDIFFAVKYPAPKGDCIAYLSRHPEDGKKRPAIIWITGGDCNSIGESAWEQAQRENDQSARAFRQEGIVMMFPSLRGGNGNPGFKEGFFGEVDDILAAADFLAAEENVDPSRIYLGGHSTGGTLAMLVAECSTRFRAVFAFGPVSDVAGYGPDSLPFRDDKKELELRAPGRWLNSIQSPVFVFEGEESPGNVHELRKMSNLTTNTQIRFHPVAHSNHFSILAPVTRLVAKKILADRGSSMNIEFTTAELEKAVGR